MNRPVISLLTDFGSSDHYVGAMKGVMLGICPDAQLVDISHEIRPYAIAEAAFTLSQCWGCFPAGTVHLVVVDPGVGSSRRALIAEAAGHLFVAPDNGVLTMVQNSVRDFRAHEITAERLFRHPVSRTFHGRDIFAPVAAHLAAGAAVGEAGVEIAEVVRLPIGKPVKIASDVWAGSVLRVDRFGNLVSNFESNEFQKVASTPFELRAGEHRITQYRTDYVSAEPGELFLISGSSGFLEVSLNQGDASKQIQIIAGAVIQLSFDKGDAVRGTGTVSIP